MPTGKFICNLWINRNRWICAIKRVDSTDCELINKLNYYLIFNSYIYQQHQSIQEQQDHVSQVPAIASRRSTTHANATSRDCRRQ